MLPSFVTRRGLSADAAFIARIRAMLMDFCLTDGVWGSNPSE